MPSHLIAITQKRSDPIDPRLCRDGSSPRTTWKKCSSARAAAAENSDSCGALIGSRVLCRRRARRMLLAHLPRERLEEEG